MRIVDAVALDPHRGVIRWAARRASDHLANVIIAALALPVVGAIIGDQVGNAALGAAAAFGIFLVLGFLYALVVAPYEQRKTLRGEVAELRGQLSTREPNVVFYRDELAQLVSDATGLLMRGEPLTTGPSRTPGGPSTTPGGYRRMNGLRSTTHRRKRRSPPERGKRWPGLTRKTGPSITSGSSGS